MQIINSKAGNKITFSILLSLIGCGGVLIAAAIIDAAWRFVF